ncbi:MAG: DEAD/DEAH box helicase [Flavobacteriaceae bacterium]|nr:DEAD/DEAH box helicase [Flavobacteriaceae bacterium]
MSFDSLGLTESLLRAIKTQGYTQPSPIQQKAIPLILERKDVLASAQTGTGKTAGFTLPMLQILSQQAILRHRPVRALVLTPTRELAAQVFENVKEYGAFLELKSTVIFGGVSQKSQVTALRNGVDVLIATPGRLLDLHQQRLLSLKNIQILVLDEADRMLDMGFLRDIKKIMTLMPAQRQNLLFSATFSKEIKALAREILNEPVLVEATPENTTVEKINQQVYEVDKSAKSEVLIQLISEGDWEQVLVFTRTKHGANKLTQKLQNSNISALAIHGNKSQSARTKALEGFKKGTTRVLVATDIAARGLDIPLLPHVVNYELPNIAEDYVHRIGRTGRAGASGIAVSLVSADEKGYLKDIEKLIGQQIPKDVIPGFLPDPNAPTVIDKPKRQQQSRRRTNKPGSNRSSGTHKSSPQRNKHRGTNRSKN